MYVTSFNVFNWKFGAEGAFEDFVRYAGCDVADFLGYVVEDLTPDFGACDLLSDLLGWYAFGAVVEDTRFDLLINGARELEGFVRCIGGSN